MTTPRPLTPFEPEHVQLRDLSVQPLIGDSFAMDVARGRVIGSDWGGGARGGADVERLLSVDHRALRIQPPIRPGWGKCGIAYGPFRRSAGLALAVKVDNGHNMSQSYELNSWLRQTARWLLGGGTDKPGVRFARWLGHQPRIALARKVHRWYESRKRGRPFQHVRENLAAGFYPEASPRDPVKTGNGFVIHASRVFDSGELWARVGPGCFSTCASLQNLTLQYFVVLRERGAIYYASGLAGAHGVGSYPNMRPIAIDSFNEDREVHAGVHQAVLGEIGFTMDTRVHGVRVAELGADFGTAHAADSLRGVGPLDASAAEEGGLWRAVGLERTGEGARGRGVEARATLETGRASGLIHALIEPTEDSRPTGLTFRVQDARNLWAVVAGPGGCSVRLCEDGKWMTVAEDPTSLQPGREASLQVVDHGSEFTVGINGAMAFGRRFVDGRLREATGVGLWSSGAGESALIRDFEAHPREVSIPQALDQGPPWCTEGSRILVRDCFAGAQGELAGRVTTAGNKTWRHDLGEGRFEVTGEGAARVHASIGVPSPGRTIYTIDWDDPELADLDVEMTPPGTRRGENHRGRGGMVFWQDRLNYFMINLWLHDNLETASISTFFCINGFDDLYDAIWTCTGPNRTKWGVPFRFRSVFDGDHFLVRIDGEPVLQRRLTDVYPRQRAMKITRIGLFTNWEWGTDTGTIFRDLVARGR